MNKYDFIQQLCDQLNTLTSAIINSSVTTAELVDLMRKTQSITDLLLKYTKE